MKESLPANENISIEKYEKMLEDTHEELESVFGFSIDDVGILIAKDREEYNKISGSKNTADWVIGTIIGNSKILILSPEIWHKEAKMHNPDTEPASLIKHELVHIYVKQISNRKSIPVWLNEGLAVFLSGQLHQHKLSSKDSALFFELTAEEKDWHGIINSKVDAYGVAGFFLEYLSREYSLEIIIKLIERIGASNKSEYEKIYKEIFGKEIKQLQQDFIENILK